MQVSFHLWSLVKHEPYMSALEVIARDKAPHKYALYYGRLME